MLMLTKQFLRKLGYDIVRYHPQFDALARPLGIRTILDIGANTGAYARTMRETFPDTDIISFEPLPDCFAQLEHAMHGDEKFRALNVALGEKNGTTTMQRSSFHPSSSLRPMAALHKTLYPKSAQMTEQKIEIRRLDDLAPELKLEQPLLIKMDVQGFEDAVMRGGRETISRASLLVIETSFVTLYEGQPLFADIHALAREMGFVYHGRGESHFDKTDKLLYEDALFMKELLDA